MILFWNITCEIIRKNSLIDKWMDKSKQEKNSLLYYTQKQL